MKVKILKPCTWWKDGYDRRELVPGTVLDVSENFGRHAVASGVAELPDSSGEVKSGNVVRKDIGNSGTADAGGGKASPSGRKRRG